MLRYNDYSNGKRYGHSSTKKEKEKFTDVDMIRFKELHVFTPDGVKSFDTKGLAQIESYGAYTKNRVEKIIQRIFSKSGIIKLANGEKIDLTMQTQEPVIVYKDR
jgi:hypothetical protein